MANLWGTAASAGLSHTFLHLQLRSLDSSLKPSSTHIASITNECGSLPLPSLSDNMR